MRVHFDRNVDLSLDTERIVMNGWWPLSAEFNPERAVGGREGTVNEREWTELYSRLFTFISGSSSWPSNTVYRRNR